MHATRIGGCVAIVLGEGATGPTRALGALADWRGGVKHGTHCTIIVIFKNTGPPLATLS